MFAQYVLIKDSQEMLIHSDQCILLNSSLKDVSVRMYLIRGNLFKFSIWYTCMYKVILYISFASKQFHDLA